jgi:hypothetical protein
MSKQETLEDACDRVLNYLYPNCKKEMSSLQYGNSINSLKYIAKWQAEIMYSEEDMREAFKQGHKSARAMGSYNDITEQEDYNKWFEQFKKK